MSEEKKHCSNCRWDIDEADCSKVNTCGDIYNKGDWEAKVCGFCEHLDSKIDLKEYHRCKCDNGFVKEESIDIYTCTHFANRIDTEAKKCSNCGNNRNGFCWYHINRTEPFSPCNGSREWIPEPKDMKDCNKCNEAKKCMECNEVKGNWQPKEAQNPEKDEPKIKECNDCIYIRKDANCQNGVNNINKTAPCFYFKAREESKPKEVICKDCINQINHKRIWRTINNCTKDKIIHVTDMKRVCKSFEAKSCESCKQDIECTRDNGPINCDDTLSGWQAIESKSKCNECIKTDCSFLGNGGLECKKFEPKSCESCNDEGCHNLELLKADYDKWNVICGGDKGLYAWVAKEQIPPKCLAFIECDVCLSWNGYKCIEGYEKQPKERTVPVETDCNKCTHYGLCDHQGGQHCKQFESIERVVPVEKEIAVGIGFDVDKDGNHMLNHVAISGGFETNKAYEENKEVIDHLTISGVDKESPTKQEVEAYSDLSSTMGYPIINHLAISSGIVSNNKKQKEETKMEKNCKVCEYFNGQGKVCKCSDNGDYPKANSLTLACKRYKLKEVETPMEDIKKEIERKKLKIQKVKEEIVKEKKERENLFKGLDFTGKTHHPYLHRTWQYSDGWGKPRVFNKKYLKFLKCEGISIKRVKSLKIRIHSSGIELFNTEDLLKLKKQKWRRLEETVREVIACQDDYCLMNLKDELCRLNKCKSKLLAIEEEVKEEEVCNCKKYIRKKSIFCPRCGLPICPSCRETLEIGAFECSMCGWVK